MPPFSAITFSAQRAQIARNVLFSVFRSLFQCRSMEFRGDKAAPGTSVIHKDADDNA